MPHSVIAETEDTDDPSVMPALTRNGYTRYEKTDGDIAALVAGSEPELLRAFAETDETRPNYRCSEALIFFLRRASRQNELALRNKLFDLLLVRCQIYFRGAVRGFDPVTRMDVQQDVLADLARLITAADDSGDFLECRFLSYLQRETARARGKMRQRFHRAPLIGDIVEDADAEDLFVANHRHEQVLAEADRARVREGVAMLPEPYRELIVLRYFEGWQIGDERNPDRDGGGRVTLAKKYDVTPRTIQNWLAKAYALMIANWKDDQ